MRIESADRLKGLCIVLMIVGHCLIPEALHDAIYLFHIPMFFFIAGFFFKPAPIGNRLRSDARRLLVPYVVCILAVSFRYGIDSVRLGDGGALVRYLISALVVGPGIDFLRWSDLDVGPVWFLVALFWCRTVFNLLLRLRYGIGISITLGALCCSVGSVVCLPFGLMHGMMGLFFAAMGRVAAGHRERFQGRGALPVAALCTVPAFFIHSLDMHTGLFPCYALNLFVSVAACSLLWNVFYAVESSNYKILSFLSWAGRFSLLVLMVHYFEFMALFLNEKLSFLPGYAFVAFRVGMDLAVSFVLSKIPFVRKFCIL